MVLRRAPFHQKPFRRSPFAPRPTMSPVGSADISSPGEAVRLEPVLDANGSLQIRINRI